MKHIEVIVYGAKELPPKQIKISENATIDELLQAAEEAGIQIPDYGEEFTLTVDGKGVCCSRLQRVNECGIKSGTKVQLFPVTIIVNAREKSWYKKAISYEDLVVLAFEAYSNDPNVLYTITYFKGPQQNHEGSLVQGHSVKVKGGMIFNVTQTNKS